MDRQKTIDKAVLGLFQGRNSSFLTTIYCSLRFSWDDSQPTAYTDGLRLGINFDWFLTLSEKMRITLIAHELWHVAYMHMFRRGERDPEIWNMAADHAINLMLKEHGYHFDPDPMDPSKTMGLADPRFSGMSAEQIYEVLISESTKVNLPFGADFGVSGKGPGEASSDAGNGGQTPAEANQLAQAEVLANVVRACTMSKMNSKEAGTLPGDFSELIDNLLNPRLPWELLLARWFTERSQTGYNWKIPNRRYQDMYLPSRGGQEGLRHILWALDTSGSVTSEQLRIFNSEIAGIKERLLPEKMTVVSFDTKIQDIWEFDEADELQGLHFHGRGGTNMKPVFKYAAKTQPAALVMFSDMWCTIPKEIPGIPVLWLCFDHPDWEPPYGDVIHVDSIPSTAA